MREFVIIADDFTGANDTGVQVKKHGIPMDVILNIDDILGNQANLSIDTESRVVSSDEAYERVSKVVRSVIAQGGCHHLYKKVDSTLRGNIVAEIKAVIHEYQPDIIVFAPAYPEQGRIVQHGVLQVHGVPLLQTEIAKDPRNPIFEDNIVTLLAACTGQPIQAVSIADIENGRIGHNETGCYAFDSATSEHLTSIAAVMMQEHKKTLWIGSAGLAEGLLSVVHPGLPVLAVVGSVSSKTMEQIAFCREHHVQLIKLDMIDLYNGASLDEVVRLAVDQLREQHDVLLTAAATRADYEAFVTFGEKRGIAGEELAEFTKQTLSRAAIMTMEGSNYHIGGLFLTGGDTAIAVTRMLGAAGSHIEAQLLPGFVLGRLIGGVCADLPIVTKAGAFGTAADIYEAVCRLKEK